MALSPFFVFWILFLEFLDWLIRRYDFAVGLLIESVRNARLVGNVLFYVVVIFWLGS